MPGWGMGFVCGNARMIAALARIKSYLDYGAFQPIQIASIIALEGDQKVVDEIVEVHRKRRDVLVDGLNKLGWQVPKPKGTMFVWAPIPEPFRAMGSLEFAKLCIQEARVAVSPGIAGGVRGDPGVHVVIELVGGLEPARTFILRALAAGKHVVTANKALLAHHGAELYEEARRRGVTLAFEAAVAGGIPLIRAVKEGLAANRVLALAGIVNGTCNYILSKMTDEGIDFSLVLKEAQAQGYAKADPTLDIEGMDSAHKLQILVSLAFRTFIDLKDIHTEGITRVTPADIAYARELGYRIKLLAIATASGRAGRGAERAGVEVRVHPTMIPAASPLAAVSGAFNPIFITLDAARDLVSSGRG